ncbi:hypothetical protein Tco_0535082 [Tanacetum coccineum]
MVMGSEEFFDKHKGAHVVFLPYGISDHNPVVLTIHKALKANKKSFRDGGIMKDYTIDLEDEEKLMFQRAKVNWLNDGADNVRYHGDQVPTQFVNHFKSFLGTQNGRKCLDLDPNIFLNKINPQDAYAMVGDVTNDEIKRMVNWIMTCVTTPSYSICVNGEWHGHFKGGRLNSACCRMSSSKFTTIALLPLCFDFAAVDEDLSPLAVKVLHQQNFYFDPPKGTLVPRVQLAAADEVEAKRSWMSSSKFTTIALLPLCFAFAAVDEDLSPLAVKGLHQKNFYCLMFI